jgi:hypothetical protein
MFNVFKLGVLIYLFLVIPGCGPSASTRALDAPTRLDPNVEQDAEKASQFLQGDPDAK